MRACFFNHRLRVVKLVMQAWVKLVVQRHFLRSIDGLLQFAFVFLWDGSDL